MGPHLEGKINTCFYHLANFFSKKKTKNQSPEWTTQTTTQPAQGNILKAESADHMKQV